MSFILTISAFFEQAMGPIGLMTVFLITGAFLSDWQKRNQIATMLFMLVITGIGACTVPANELKFFYVGMMTLLLTIPNILNRNLRYYKEESYDETFALTQKTELENKSHNPSDMVIVTPKKVLEIVPIENEVPDKVPIPTAEQVAVAACN